MEEKYKVVICFTDKIPFYLGSLYGMGAGDFYWGTISFGIVSVSLKQKRYLFRRPVEVIIPYKDIDYYDTSLSDITLKHHNPNLPKNIIIESGLIFWAFPSRKIKKIESAFENHGIKRTANHAKNWRYAGTNKFLVYFFISLITLLILFVVIFNVVKFFIQSS